MTDMRGFLAWLENGFTGLRRIQSHLPPQTTTSPMGSEIWPRTFLKITIQGKQKQRMWNHAQERLPQDLRKKTFYREIWTSTDFHSPLYRLRRARHRTKRNGLSNPNARWKRVAEMPAEHERLSIFILSYRNCTMATRFLNPWKYISCNKQNIILAIASANEKMRFLN